MENPDRCGGRRKERTNSAWASICREKRTRKAGEIRPGNSAACRISSSALLNMALPELSRGRGFIQKKPKGSGVLRIRCLVASRVGRLAHVLKSRSRSMRRLDQHSFAKPYMLPCSTSRLLRLAARLQGPGLYVSVSCGIVFSERNKCSVFLVESHLLCRACPLQVRAARSHRLIPRRTSGSRRAHRTRSAERRKNGFGMRSGGPNRAHA